MKESLIALFYSLVLTISTETDSQSNALLNDPISQQSSQEDIYTKAIKNSNTSYKITKLGIAIFKITQDMFKTFGNLCSLSQSKFNNHIDFKIIFNLSNEISQENDIMEQCRNFLTGIFQNFAYTDVDKTTVESMVINQKSGEYGYICRV